jgi:hypothetical protein
MSSMKIDNPELRASYRGQICEWCRSAVATDAAHLIHSGIGGGKQIDLPISLVGLCRRCHSAHHSANSGNRLHPNFMDLLKLISRRERIEPEVIIDRIRLLQRLPKDAEIPSWATT